MIGTDNGLIRFRENKFYKLPIDSIFNNKRVMHITTDSNRKITIATNQGFYIIDSLNIFHYSEENGLSNNYCYFTQQDRQGWLWIGTNKGLNRFNGSQFKIYTQQDGIASNEFNQHSCLMDYNYRLWFGSGRGITLCRPEQISNSSVPPKINIIKFSVFDQPYPMKANLTLNYHENYIHFEFDGISLANPQSLYYRYELQGIDKSDNITSFPEVRYSFLPPGAYRFKIWAVNGDGTLSLNAVALDFIIQPPFWKTWWFRSLLFFLIIGIICWTIRRLLRKNLLLEDKVRQRTIEIYEKNCRLEEEKQKVELANQELRELKEKFERASLEDPLTKLSNRRDLLRRMSDEVARARRYKKPFAFLLGDIDFFKKINDTYGHDAGDLVLVMIANLLKHNLRANDIICRWGGRNF